MRTHTKTLTQIGLLLFCLLAVSIMIDRVQTARGAAVERVPPRITFRYPARTPIVVRDPGVTLDAVISDASGLRSVALRILSGGVITTRTICGTAKIPCPARLELASFAGRNASFMLAPGTRTSMVLDAVDGVGNAASRNVQFDYAPRLTVHASHTPNQPSEGEAMRVRAVGENAFLIGANLVAVTIRQITWAGERVAAECRPDEPAPRIECEAAIPFSARPFGYTAYYAVVEDNTGARVVGAVHRVFGRPYGLDDDGDGLTNAEESALCTDPSNPDSDHDSLLDGWEVRGQRFADGTKVDLPGMGANPCSADAFIELDWAADAAHSHRPPDAALTNLSNLLLGYGIFTHIDTGQWGGGKAVPHSNPDGTPYFVGNSWVNQLSAKERHFDPRRLWSFFYGVMRHADRGVTGSAYRDTLFAVDAADGLAARGTEMLHELGHLMGLGHGGTTGDGSQRRNGRAVWYAGTPQSTNFQPNYISIMNYAYGGGALFVRPGTQYIRYFPQFSDGTAYPLDENALDERPASAFNEWLRARRPPNDAAEEDLTAAFLYSCTDPRDGLRYWQIADGTRIVKRTVVVDERNWREVRPYSHPPGIDWNCDGRINESPVRADVNQDGAFTVLEDRNDLRFIPGLPACRQMTRMVEGVGYPSESYLASGGDPPTCGVGYAGGDAYIRINDPIRAFAEQCDGIDNNENGVVDEECADSDGDGIADMADNCPRDANEDQADHDGDGRGDACSAPLSAPRGLRAQTVSGTNAVTLSWDVDFRARGYVVYRRSGEKEVFKPVAKKTYPTVQDGRYIDAGAATLLSAGKTVEYYIVPVSATTGTEGIGAGVGVSIVPAQPVMKPGTGVILTP